jgi:hypothetical protein
MPSTQRIERRRFPGSFVMKPLKAGGRGKRFRLAMSGRKRRGARIQFPRSNAGFDFRHRDNNT